MAAPPGVTPWLQRKPLRPPTRRIVYGEAVSVTRVSGIHYRGPTIRRVSSYALLRRCQLPWPHSHCLHRETLFGGSMSEYLATLTTCTVDPALPDLLTRLGPLALDIQSTGGHYDFPRRIVHLGSMFGVVGDRSSQRTPYSISTAHCSTWMGRQLSCGTFRRKPATRWFDESLATMLHSDEQFAR